MDYFGGVCGRPRRGASLGWAWTGAIDGLLVLHKFFIEPLYFFIQCAAPLVQLRVRARRLKERGREVPSKELI